MYINHDENISTKSKILDYCAKNKVIIVYTVCIVFNQMCYGMAQTVFGATMVDLQYLLRTTTTLISLSQTASGVGFLVGSLSGFLYKYINRQLTIVVMVSMMAIFGGLYPWCPSIWWLYGASAVGGVGAGAWDSASSIWMVEMWAHNSGPLLQILQCMYGLGSIVGPLIVGQYVLGDMACEGTDGDTTTTQALGDTTTALILITTTDINYSVDRGSRLKPPFAIIAVLGVIAPIALLILFIVKRYRAPQPANTTSDIGSVHSDDPVVVVELRGSKSDRIILIIIMSLTFITYSGFELMHFTYSSTYYQYKHILSAKTATTVLSLMAATFTAGRLVAAVVAIKLRPQVMIGYSLCILCVSMAVLYFGQNNETMIWTGNALIGIGYSAMRPAYFAFSEEAIGLTDRVSSIFSFCSSLLMLITPLVIGPLIKPHPAIFLYLELLYLLLTLLLFAALLIQYRRSKGNIKSIYGIDNNESVMYSE